MPPKKQKKQMIDLAELPAGKSNRIKRFMAGDKRAFRKRDKVLGLRFASEDIEAWHQKAKAKKETITDWMERVCNAAD